MIRERQKRNHRLTVMLNESEWNALLKYQKKYAGKNRSLVVRDVLMRGILKRFDKDSPTLFDF